MSPEEIKNAVCKELDERKAVDITVLNVADLTVIADYFVICTARSNKQVKALAEYVEEKLEEAGVPTRARANGRCWTWAASSCISSTTTPACSIALKNSGLTAATWSFTPQRSK